MVQTDPDKRPTIHETVDRFTGIRRPLNSRTHRSRLVWKEDKRSSVFTTISHFFRTAGYILMRRNALPRPPETPLHTFTW